MPTSESAGAIMKSPKHSSGDAVLDLYKTVEMAGERLTTVLLPVDLPRVIRDELIQAIRSLGRIEGALGRTLENRNGIA